MPNNKNKKSATPNGSSLAVIAMGLVIVLLVGALIASILTTGFTKADPYHLFSKEAPAASSPDDNSDDPPALASDDVFILNPQSSDHVKLLAVTLPESQSSVRLTATITPENYDGDKSLDWTIAFKNPSSSWASGKTVTDYVKVVPTSDGALTADVNYSQAFGEQIIVTVSLRDDATKKATCTVDCAAKYKIVPFSGYFDDDSYNLNYDSTPMKRGLEDYCMRIYIIKDNNIPYTIADDDLKITYSIDWNNFNVDFAAAYANIESLDTTQRDALADLFFGKSSFSRQLILQNTQTGKSQPGAANVDKYDYFVDIFILSAAIYAQKISPNLSICRNYSNGQNLKDTIYFIGDFMNYILSFEFGSESNIKSTITKVFGLYFTYTDNQFQITKDKKLQNKFYYAVTHAFNSLADRYKYKGNNDVSNLPKYVFKLDGQYTKQTIDLVFDFGIIGQVKEPANVALDQDNVVFN